VKTPIIVTTILCGTLLVALPHLAEITKIWLTKNSFQLSLTPDFDHVIALGGFVMIAFGIRGASRPQ